MRAGPPPYRLHRKPVRREGQYRRPQEMRRSAQSRARTRSTAWADYKVDHGFVCDGTRGGGPELAIRRPDLRGRITAIASPRRWTHVLTPRSSRIFGDSLCYGTDDIHSG